MGSFICLFIIDKDPSLTGAPRTVLNLLTGLQGSGFRPILVTQRESILTERLCANDVSVEVLPLPPLLDVFDEGVLSYSLTDKLKSVGALLKYNRRLADVAKTYDADGVWARQIKGVMLSGFAASWMRIPLIWDIGVEKESKGLVYLLHWFGLFLSTKVVTQARIQPRVIFGERRESLFQEKFVAIRPGIDEVRRRKIEQEVADVQARNTVELITVGSIHPRKNQKMLLEVLTEVVPIFRNVRVRIVGAPRDEAYAKELRRFVDNNGLNKHVEFLGWRDDIPELLGDSDLFVLCSQAEGVPQVVREAMYARLPIIATAVGGVPEAVQHERTGYLVPSTNQRLMKIYILSLLKEPETRKRFGNNAYKRAKDHFSMESWISSYINLLNELITRR
jgi:glycosyltransferase involved in cell wall biosynthesis